MLRPTCMDHKLLIPNPALFPPSHATLPFLVTWLEYLIFSPCTVQLSSVAQSCPTLCVPMNFSMPGLPVHHQLLEFTQTHVHRVSDAIQPSHPLSSPSPLAPNPSQRSNCQHSLDHEKSKRVPEKHLFLLY